MKSLIVAVAIALAVPTQAQAQSVKLPAAYLGTWCATAQTAQSNMYRRCHEADGEDAMEIHARHSFNAESRCAPLAIVPDCA